MRRAWAAPLAVALVLTGCPADGGPDPDPTPSPSPSVPVDDSDPGAAGSQPRVAVVLPDEDEVAGPLETYRDAIARVRASFDGQLDDVRVVNLDAAGFRPDVLLLLGDEGTSLTCAIGAGARDVVAVAQQLPGRRFCVVDDRIEEVPANVVAAWFRYEEAAYLLGFAAASMLPPDATGGTLGLLTPSFDTRSERQRLAFTAGARSVRPEVSVIVQSLTGDGDAPLAERATEAAAMLYDERGAAVVMLTSGVPVEPVLEVAQARQRLVAGIGPTLPAGVPPELEPFVLATAHARVEVGLALPIARQLEAWEGGVSSLGFADEALVLTPGGSVRWDEVRDAVADLRARIERGEVPLS